MSNWQNKIVAWENVAPEQLLANPANFRRHPAKQREALRGSLNELDIIAPVIVNRITGHLLDGHARVEEYLSAGVKECPVAFVEIPEEKEALALLSLDPIAAMAEADKEALDALLRDVATGEEGLQKMLAELAKDAGLYLEEPKAEDPGAQIDKAEELREKWGTERGQIWEVGRHRVMCGDSTSAEDVGRLVGGNADLCFTSPPYGVGKNSKIHEHYVRGAVPRKSLYAEYDDTPSEWPRLMDGWWNAVRPVVGAAVVNVQMLASNKAALIQWMAERSDELCDVLIWDKGHGIPQMQTGVLNNAFEFLFVFGGNGSRSIPFSDWHGTVGNMVRVGKSQNDYAGVHNAVFPVALPAWVMETLCPVASSVMDPFMGTGSTAVAAEQTKRICYGMEIEPKYVAITLERLAGMGLEPRLL